jgi:hypothetical protein
LPIAQYGAQRFDCAFGFTLYKDWLMRSEKIINLLPIAEKTSFDRYLSFFICKSPDECSAPLEMWQRLFYRIGNCNKGAMHFHLDLSNKQEMGGGQNLLKISAPLNSVKICQMRPLLVSLDSIFNVSFSP